uniref:Uncharacterized protein n=1 Tax=Acrobeloides nanus TaxID=290746 RepID=A0A914DQ61_9BILA
MKCQKFSIDEEEDNSEMTMFVCGKLKPIEKSLPEKLFSNGPLVLSAVVLLIMSIFVCICIWCVCGCCRKKTNRRNDNSSRTPLEDSLDVC